MELAHKYKDATREHEGTTYKYKDGNLMHTRGHNSHLKSHDGIINNKRR